MQYWIQPIREALRAVDVTDRAHVHGCDVTTGAEVLRNGCWTFACLGCFAVTHRRTCASPTRAARGRADAEQQANTPPDGPCAARAGIAR